MARIWSNQSLSSISPGTARWARGFGLAVRLAGVMLRVRPRPLSPSSSALASLPVGVESTSAVARTVSLGIGGSGDSNSRPEVSLRAVANDRLGRCDAALTDAWEGARDPLCALAVRFRCSSMSLGSHADMSTVRAYRCRGGGRVYC